MKVLKPLVKYHQKAVAISSSNALGQWLIQYAYAEVADPTDETRKAVEFADTEADARAKMLVYLIENKLITLS